MSDVVLGAQQYAKLRQASTKAAFENRFYFIQQGLIKNLNKEILKTNDEALVRKVAAIQKERDKMIEIIPKIRDYQFNLQTNTSRFLEIQNDAVEGLTLDEDANDQFSSNEANKLNVAKLNIAEKIRNLVEVNFPGIVDGNLVGRMRMDADSLEKLTATEGVIDDDEATGSNENRKLLNLVTQIGEKAQTFSESSSILVYSTNKMLMDLDKSTYIKQAELSTITAAEIARKTEEIEKIKLQYSNMLQVISMSFETNSGLSDLLADGAAFQPDGGSILNLFV